jgi:hypothetical protein
MIQLCRHIRPEGTQCSAPALLNRRFCHYHEQFHSRPRRAGLQTAPLAKILDSNTLDANTLEGGRLSLAETSDQLPHPPLEMLFPEDRASIQINLHRILDALAHNLIDLSTANAMTYNMRACMANLARKPLVETPSAVGNSEPAALRVVQRVILTPEGDEIAPPVEILEEHEAEPVHHRLCPCLTCAEKYRGWPGELHHAECQCGLCEEQYPAAAKGPRIARAAALLSGSPAQDPLNRPWSVADYTFGDSVRRHEAQYAARAAAALAAGIEPPPYEPFVTGLVDPASDEGLEHHLEDQERQRRTNEYWVAHFRKQLADRPDVQQALAAEQPGKPENNPENSGEIAAIQARAEQLLRHLPIHVFTGADRSPGSPSDPALNSFVHHAWFNIGLRSRLKSKRPDSRIPTGEIGR